MQKKIFAIIVATLMLSIPLFALSANVIPASAALVPSPPIVTWSPTGEAEHLTLAWNPEYLKIWTSTRIHSDTTIIVQGLDTYGQNIEASAEISAGTSHSKVFQLVDPHTDEPVAFAKVTAIFQQGGTHCNAILIMTEPEPFEEYLGQYHTVAGWEPGIMSLSHPDEGPYLVGYGDDEAYTIDPLYPVEPSNPDPIKILINWADEPLDPQNPDSCGDLFPQEDELGNARYDTTIYVEGLDEAGNKLIGTATILGPKPGRPGDSKVVVDAGDHTFSTICKIRGGDENDEYYIFTEPLEERELFKYNLRIDHIVVIAECYNILANPDTVIDTTEYPGRTTITVTLRDQDNHLIHAGAGDGIDDESGNGGSVLINLATTGGEIAPSCDLWIPKCSTSAEADLYADTNARTIKVTATANVEKEHPGDPEIFGPRWAWNLVGWTELCFDGVNSVYFTGWPIHMLMWGYGGSGDNKNPVARSFPVPPLPWPTDKELIDEEDKFDGPLYEIMIPLVPGCNLISCPVRPILCGEYDPEIDLLFGETSATTCIESIWWYEDGQWWGYIVETRTYVGDTAYINKAFRAGIGYWIKAEKPCTLELSGVLMDQYPFTPITIELPGQSWSLVGVYSILPIKTKDDLESASGDGADAPGISAVGPVWVYAANNRIWARNPEWLWPTQGFWVFNKVPATMYIAP